MDKTFEFLRPAMKMGEFTTGIFIAAGSVGELEAAEPLRQMLENPDEYDIYSVETNLLDDTGLSGNRGLFIPEQWGMPPYIDDYGNSIVAEALAALDADFEEHRKKLSPQAYQLRVSQHPRNIKEAFSSRKVSVFRPELIEHQTKQIEDKLYPYECIDIQRNIQKAIVVRKTDAVPISDFPIKKNMINKEGAIQVWERPDKNAEHGTYIASIDPVGVGKTSTSESLCSIYIYKLPIHVTRETEQGIENFIEGDKIVACWCGRFDDINKTHERLELLIEWYNAQTLIESNISAFIQHMMSVNKQSYLVTKNNMLFLKEIEANKSVFQEYGWRNTGSFFKTQLIKYLIDFIGEVVEEEVDDFGVITKSHYGIRRIPDIMALKEMAAYQEGVNVDRLVALTALVAYIKVLEANHRIHTREENVSNNLQNQENLYKLNSNAFRHVGRNAFMSSNIKKSPFKRIR